MAGRGEPSKVAMLAARLGEAKAEADAAVEKLERTLVELIECQDGLGVHGISVGVTFGTRIGAAAWTAARRAIESDGQAPPVMPTEDQIALRVVGDRS